MRYLSVTEIAKKWNVSERSVRNYCAHGRVTGAFLTGKTWNIPENAEKPERSNKKKEQPVTLLDILQEQKASKYSGGIYHKTQIDLTYNSNHIEGSRLTHDQTRYIFETNTIGVENEVLNVDDVIETANHFRCIDMIIDNAKAALTEKFIKKLHLILKDGTSDSRKDWFVVGDYKKLPNEVGGMDTALPEEVADKMKALLTEYKAWYQAHNCIKTRPYPGIPELLDKLRKSGVQVAIVSNKPDPTTKALAEKFFPDVPAFGQRDDLPPKPAPEMVYHALKEMGGKRENTVYVGDSEVDIQTARNCVMDYIGVSWGFRGREKLLSIDPKATVVDRAEEILKIIR